MTIGRPFCLSERLPVYLQRITTTARKWIHQPPFFVTSALFRPSLTLNRQIRAFHSNRSHENKICNIPWVAIARTSLFSFFNSSAAPCVLMADLCSPTFFYWKSFRKSCPWRWFLYCHMETIDVFHVKRSSKPCNFFDWRVEWTLELAVEANVFCAHASPRFLFHPRWPTPLKWWALYCRQTRHQVTGLITWSVVQVCFIHRHQFGLSSVLRWKMERGPIQRNMTTGHEVRPPPWTWPVMWLMWHVNYSGHRPKWRVLFQPAVTMFVDGRPITAI